MLTARAQRLKDWVSTVHPGVTFGEQEIRPIAGTNDPSEHSFGNALDMFGPKGTLLTLAEELDKARAKWEIEVLCYDPGVGRKYDHCTTKHVDHIHADFGPHCGGEVSASGSPNDLVARCNEFQGEPSQGDGFLGIPGAIGDIMGDIETTVNKVLIVGLGIVLVVAGAALMLADTAVGKNLKAAAKTVATKGAG